MSKLSDMCAKARVTLQPWQEDFMGFMLWLRKKHPEVELHIVAYPWSPRRNGKTTMRRLRDEYEEERASAPPCADGGTCDAIDCRRCQQD